MKLYLLRALRYILRISVILAIAFAILHFTGTLNTGGQSLVEALFMSRRGALLMAALILISLAYPKLSFTEAYVPGSMKQDRQLVTDAMRKCNFSLKREDAGKMVFCPDSTVRRLLTGWNDAVTVRDADGTIAIEGMKKDVVRIELHIKAMKEQ